MNLDRVSYKHGPSWHGPSWHVPSRFLGRVVRNSIGFAFHRYNEIFILEMR